MTIPAEIEVYFESYEDEHAAYASAIEKVRTALAGVKGVTVRPKFRKGDVTGVAEPDPRD